MLDDAVPGNSDSDFQTVDVDESEEFEYNLYEDIEDEQPVLIQDTSEDISEDTSEVPDYTPEEAAPDHAETVNPDDWTPPDKCEDAYPKFINDKLEKCPSDRSSYKLGFIRQINSQNISIILSGREKTTLLAIKISNIP